MNFDSYSTPEGETLLRTAKERLTASRPADRVLITEAVAAISCLGLAIVLAVAGSSDSSLDAPRLAVAAIAYLVVSRVRFPVAAGWARPTELVFVPMLFLLPAKDVPLVIIGCLLLNLWSELPRGRVAPLRVMAVVADGAHALGPAAVLVCAHATSFGWTHWPIYAAAFGAQLVVDYTTYMTRSWFAEGSLPGEQTQVAWAYLTDCCLACCGLLLAPTVVQRPALLLLALPMTGLFGLFAREREQRLDQTVELSSAYRGVALVLSDVVEADHEYTGLHSRQVVDLSLAVARRLKLDPTALLNVEFGALLHDVGKIRVPAEIIDKPGPLDDDEWLIMREHTLYGQEMLERVGGTLSRVGRVVRSSHEHFDGSGYPDQLAGANIPIESRIISICDAYNAMTTTRSYRPGMAPSAALDELLRCSGTQFDPAVVAAIVREVGLVP